MEQQTTAIRPDFGPALTTDEGKRLVDAVGGFGPHLKLIARILSMTGAELTEAYRPDVVENDGDTLLGTVDVVGELKKSLEGQVAMAAAAEARLLVVGEYLEEGATA